MKVSRLLSDWSRTLPEPGTQWRLSVLYASEQASTEANFSPKAADMGNFHVCDLLRSRGPSDSCVLIFTLSLYMKIMYTRSDIRVPVLVGLADRCWPGPPDGCCSSLFELGETSG